VEELSRVKIGIPAEAAFLVNIFQLGPSEKLFLVNELPEELSC
jgi:hypothetical protein